MEKQVDIMDLLDKNFVINENENLLMNYKGKRLNSIPSDFTAVFVVTTGINIKNDEIVRIVLIKYKNRKFDSRYDSVVIPVNNKVLEYSYQHGFLENAVDLINQGIGKTFEQQADDIWSMIQGEILVGGNTIFDISFLYKAFNSLDGREMTNDYIDIIDYYNYAYDSKMNSLWEIYGGELPYGCGTFAFGWCNFIAKTLLEIYQDYPFLAVNYDKLDRVIGRHFLITGSLQYFKPRKKLEGKIKEYGGTIDSDIKNATNYLIVGSFRGLENNKSRKIFKAEEYIVKFRARIKVVSETMFLKLFPKFQK